MKWLKKLLCKVFGHKYLYDSDNLLPLELVCKRCGYNNTIPSIKKHIDEKLNSPSKNNLKEIKETIESGYIGGKWCTDGHQMGFVVGAVATIEDYYYVVLSPKYYRIKYWSCVGHIEPTKYGDDYNFEKMFPNTLKALVEEQLEKNSNIEVLFTKLMI